MTKMANKVRKIRRQLEKQAQKQKPKNLITEQQLTEAIETHAGWDNRTIRKYRAKMLDKNIIKTDERLSTNDNKKYRINKTLEEEQQRKDINHQAERKHVTLSVNKDLLQKMDQLNINKSDFFEKYGIKKVSNLKEKIKAQAETLEDTEDIGYIRDLILEDAYMKGRNDQKRRELYLNHFGPPYNDFAAESLRKTAVKIAEKIGVEEKPQSL